MSYMRQVYGTPRKTQPSSTQIIQYNIMSTMSELHRLMQEIQQDDLDILADIAYQNEQAQRAYNQEQAMRECMDEPQASQDDCSKSDPDTIPF